MVIKKFIEYFRNKKDIIKSKMFEKTDKYICRVCNEILPESEMMENDPSICKECAKRE